VYDSLLIKQLTYPSELSVVQLVRFFVVELEPTHQRSNSRLGTGARIFLDLFQNLTDAILLVVGDVSAYVYLYAECTCVGEHLLNSFPSDRFPLAFLAPLRWREPGRAVYTLSLTS